MTKMTQTIKEYANALFMLASENHCAEDFSVHLGTIDAMVKDNPEYLNFLESPAIPLSERILAIDEAFGSTIPEYIVSFMKILVENGRILALCECITEFNELLRISQNRIIAKVYYVEPLTDEQKKALTDKLSTVSGKSVDAVYIQDNSLIGGIKVVMDDKTIDGSIANRLKKAKGVISK